MGGDEPQAPEVDVVEAAHNEANYAREREDRRDTTDDGWGSGVFADRADHTAPTAKRRSSKPDSVPDLRMRSDEPPTLTKRVRDDEDDDDEEGMSPAMLVGVTVVATLVFFGIMYGGLTALGVV